MFYGIILCIIAFISKSSMNISTGYSGYGYRIIYGISPLGMLVKGFIISFITVFILGIKKEYKLKNKYISIFADALIAMATGYLVILLLLIGMYFANINYLTDFGLSSYKGRFGMGLVVSQLAFYLWSFANFIPTTIGSNVLSLTSLIGGNLSLDILLILGAFIAISMLIFIITGSKLGNKYGNQEIKPVIIFSVCYSLIMGALGLFTLLNIGDFASSVMNNIGIFNMGFNFVLGIIISFIYSFIVTLIGFKLNTVDGIEGE